MELREQLKKAMADTIAKRRDAHKEKLKSLRTSMIGYLSDNAEYGEHGTNVYLPLISPDYNDLMICYRWLSLYTDLDVDIIKPKSDFDSTDFFSITITWK